jgi:hypothetical protein
MQAQYLRHRRRARAPRAAQAEHQGAHRGEQMAVDRPQVDRAACAATEAVNIKPWHARHHRCADRGRPQQSRGRRRAGPLPPAIPSLFTICWPPPIVVPIAAPPLLTICSPPFLMIVPIAVPPVLTTWARALTASRAARGPVDPLRGLKNWRKDAPTTKGLQTWDHLDSWQRRHERNCAPAHRHYYFCRRRNSCPSAVCPFSFPGWH